MSDPLVATITLSEPLWFSERKLTVYGNTEQNNFYAPLPVFFEGFNSTPRAEIVSYDWDFGDGSDHFSGFNAMHVYETPGTYTATLTVTRQAAVGATPETATDTIEVVVRARDGVTYYVDSALGDDSNAGTSAGAGAWKTATKAFAGIATSKYGPGDQILFERGQTFDFENNGGNSVSVGHWVARYGYKFGATGTGHAPIIKATGTGGGNLFNWTGVGGAFITFEDLEFDCTPTAGSPTIFFYNVGGGFNFLFHRVYAHDFAQGWLYSCPLTGTGVLSGIYLVDCDAYNSVTTQFYCVASRVAITGSDFDLSNNHIAYCPNVMSGVFDNNTFSRVAFGRTALRISGHGDDYPASNCWVSNNTFTGWIDPVSDSDAHNGGGTRYNYCLLNFSPSTPNSDNFGEWLVFENNKVTDSEVFATIAAWEHVIVRNNTFVTVDKEQNNKSFFCLDFDPTFSRRPLNDVQVVDNFFKYSATLLAGTKGMIGVYASTYGDHVDLVLARNVFVTSDPNVKFLSLPSGGADYLTSENNLIYCADDTQSMFTSRTTTPTHYTLEEWQSLSSNDLNTQIYENTGLPVHGWVFSNDTEMGATIPLDYDGVEVMDLWATLSTVYLWHKVPGGAWEKTALTESTASGSFTYTPEDGDGTYYFAITAEDSLGNESLAPVASGSALVAYLGSGSDPDPDPDPDPEPEPELEVIDWYGTGTDIAAPEIIPGTLLDIRRMLVLDTGDYSLVTDASNNDWSDNGANRIINDAQRWLDRAFPYKKALSWLYKYVSQGEEFVTFQRARFVKEVWIATEDGMRTRLEYKRRPWLRAHASDVYGPTGTWEGTPKYWTNDLISLAPEQIAETADTFEAAGVVDYDNIVFGVSSLPLKGIMLVPVPSTSFTLQVLAAWHSIKLVNDSDISYWTQEEPSVLLRACKMQMETDLHRNSEGRRDYEIPLMMELRQIYHDFVQEEMTGPPSRFVMKG